VSPCKISVILDDWLPSYRNLTTLTWPPSARFIRFPKNPPVRNGGTPNRSGIWVKIFDILSPVREIMWGIMAGFFTE